MPRVLVCVCEHFRTKNEHIHINVKYQLKKCFGLLKIVSYCAQAVHAIDSQQCFVLDNFIVLVGRGVLKLNVSNMQYHDQFLPMTCASQVYVPLNTQHNKVIEPKQKLGFEEM